MLRVYTTTPAFDCMRAAANRRDNVAKRYKVNPYELKLIDAIKLVQSRCLLTSQKISTPYENSTVFILSRFALLAIMVSNVAILWTPISNATARCSASLDRKR